MFRKSKQSTQGQYWVLKDSVKKNRSPFSEGVFKMITDLAAYK